MDSVALKGVPAKARRWLLVGAGLGLGVIAVVVLRTFTTSYVLDQAEMRVRDVMLESRALHWYVQRTMHPVLYEMKAEGRVPEEFYAPELLSSSFIARKIYNFYNEARREAGLPDIRYKLAAVNPRNNVNQADEFEQSLIEMFNADRSKTEYREVIEEDGRDYLYYAIPFLPMEERCLKCHSTPASAPAELQERYEWTGGFGRKAGEIVAIESIRSPLEAEFRTSSVMMVVGMTVAAILTFLFLVNTRLHTLVRRHTSALRESEERYRALFEQAGDSIVTIDPSGAILEFNDRACKALGYTREEFEQITLGDVEILESQDRVREHIVKILKDGSHVFDTRHRTKTGDVMDVRVNARVVRVLGKELIVSIWYEITDLKRIQETLRESEERLAEIAHTIEDVFWMTNWEEHRVVFVSSAYERVWGRTLEDLYGNPSDWADAIHPDDRDRAWRTFIRLGEGDIYDEEYRIIRPDGDERWIRDRGYPVRGDDGRALRAIGIAQDITDRKRAEESLRESEERYRLLFDNAAVFVSVFDADGRCLMMNRQVAAGFGGTPEEFVGKSYHELHPAMGEEYTRRVREVIDSGVPADYEDVVGFPTGDRCLLSSVHPVYDADGHAYAAQIVSQDITERECVERALRKSEAILRETGSLAKIGGWEHDLVTGEAVWTPALFEIIEVESGPVPGPNEHLDYYPPEDRAILAEAYQRAVDTGESFDLELRCHTAKGREIWARVIGRPVLEDGVCVRMAGTFQDVTERRRCEEAIRKSEGMFRAITENAADGTAILNEDGVFTYMSPAIHRMLGYEPDEIVGTTPDQIVHPADMPVVSAAIERALAGRDESVRIPEYRVRHRDGRWVTLEVTLSGMLDVPGVEGVVSNYRDVSARKRAEEVARDAQQRLLDQQRSEKERVEAELERLRDKLVVQTKLATIGQLAGSIAHELRNPLGAARNAAYYLKRYVEMPGTEVAENLDIIDEEIQSADRIITDLMDMTRSRPPRRSDADLGEIIRDALQHLDTPDGVQVFVELDPGPFPLQVDAMQLRQVVLNVLTNAFHAVQGGGEVRIRGRHLADGDEIVISDNGPGVATDHQSHVFDALFTTRAKGTGLGLTICRDIVERHGGTIELVDQETRGAALRIRLPRVTKLVPSARG